SHQPTSRGIPRPIHGVLVNQTPAHKKSDTLGQAPFPNEAAAIKCLYLVTRSLDPTGDGRARWAMRWKPALNAFAITFAGRFEKTTHE
ncbi:hypothetical protein BSZ39_11985, partial [Bowdeniella nasicola]